MFFALLRINFLFSMFLNGCLMPRCCCCFLISLYRTHRPPPATPTENYNFISYFPALKASIFFLLLLLLIYAYCAVVWFLLDFTPICNSLWPASWRACIASTCAYVCVFVRALFSLLFDSICFRMREKKKKITVQQVRTLHRRKKRV